MNQHDLNRAVAAATGETVSEISHRGFVPLTPTPVERDPRRWPDNTRSRHRAVARQFRPADGATRSERT